MERFGEKLRTLRQRHDLTVRELAAKLEVNSHSHIVQIEAGKSKPSVDLLLKIMAVFNVPCDRLIKDELELAE